MAERLTRSWLIAHRWRHVLAVGLLAFATTFVIGKLQHERLDQLAALPGWWLPVILVLGAALATALGPARFVAALRLRHVRTYPPYWFGVAVGIGAALFFIANSSTLADDFELKAITRRTLSLWSEVIGVAPFAWLALAFVTLPFRKRGASHPTISILASPDPTLADLTEWVASDKPVRDPANDLFGHKDIAAAIASRLVRNDLEAQALVGTLGSGKTTIGKLVEKYVRDAAPEPPIDFITVELWPYETPRAAVEGILRALLEGFSREINTTQLKGLPEAYGTAIAKLAGVSEWLPQVLRSTPLAPAEILEEFGEIATSIRRRFVLWIEDLERFAGGDPDAPPSMAELERLAPIRALLLGLGRIDSITVITVSTDLLRSFDIEKIAAYVEKVPDLTLANARKVIDELRKKWLEDAKVIDPVPPAVRRELGWEDAADRNELADWFGLGDHITHFAAAVAALASTPRTLKQGLRAARDTWTHLKGEIDLDDVIALSILRESHPKVYALVDLRLPALRGETIRRSTEKDALTRLKEELTNLKYDERTTLALHTILDKLFGRESKNRPQSVSRHHHADYWRRFSSRRHPAADATDQVVLKALATGTDGEIVALLLTEKSVRAVEDFARVLSATRVQGLLTPLVARLADSDASKWAERNAPGIVPLWRMIRDRSAATDKPLLASGVERGLDVAIVKNLTLLHELGYWFATHSPELPDLLDKPQRDRINAKARRLLVEHYAGRPKELVEKLRGARPVLVLQICWGIERLRGRVQGIPFDDWPKIAATLRDALAIDAGVIAPHIATFIVKENPRIRGSDQWLFDESQCQTLFGDCEKLVEDMRKALQGKTLDPMTEAVVERKTVLDPDSHSDADEVEDDESDDDDHGDAVLEQDNDDASGDEIGTEEVPRQNAAKTEPSPTSALESVPRILKELYELSTQNQEQRAIEQALSFTEAELAASRFERVDELLASAIASRLKPAVLVSILAMTSHARGQLAQRRSFLERAEAELRKQLGNDRAETLLKNRR